jgi:uncharacterized protein
MAVKNCRSLNFHEAIVAEKPQIDAARTSSHVRLVIVLLIFLCVTGSCSTTSCKDSVEITYKPTGYVNDFSHIINPQTKATIEGIAQKMAQDKQAELVVVTIPTIGAMPLNAYATKLFNQWGIGDKETNNGLMILVVTLDRKLRIEVGLGMEKKVPNSFAEKIVREMRPLLSARDFDGAVLKGTLMLRDAVSK